MTPAVSVAIPVYNAKSLIAGAVDSVLHQTFQDLELVVVDDASTDGTWEVLQQYATDPRVTLHRNESNLGMGGNWDRAFGLTSGKYVKLLCADDALYPDCLRREVTVLDERPNVVLVSCRRDIVDDLGRPLLRDWGLRGFSGEIDGREAIRRTVRSGTNQIGEPSAALLRREAVEAAGPWTTEVRYLTDIDMWFRLLRHGSLFALDETLCLFRVWPGSLSTTGAGQQAGQLRAFFRQVRRDDPAVVRPVDLVLGAARAQLLQRLRRLIFWRAARGRGRAA